MTFCKKRKLLSFSNYSLASSWTMHDISNISNISTISTSVAAVLEEVVNDRTIFRFIVISLNQNTLVRNVSSSDVSSSAVAAAVAAGVATAAVAAGVATAAVAAGAGCLCG